MITVRPCRYLYCVKGKRMSNDGQIESCPNCKGTGVIKHTKIQAFVKDREYTWPLKPYIHEGQSGSVLQLQGYISYYISDLQEPSEYLILCIDAGGRNFGVRESVYLDRKELMEVIKELQDA